MTDPQEWQDTQHLDPARARPATDGPHSAAAQQARPEQGELDFACAGLPACAELDSGVWAEAADGQCSEVAAIFAASLPAPLNIV